MSVTLSVKGQLVLPKAIRQRLNWTSGQQLEVVESGDTVLLRAKTRKGKLTTAEAIARMKANNSYRGPTVAVEDMTRDIGELIAEEYEKSV